MSDDSNQGKPDLPGPESVPVPDGPEAAAPEPAMPVSSETGPPGPGWWKASDGNWYPPESNPANSPGSAGAVSTTTKSADERKAMLAQAIAGQVAQGGRIESQSEFQAVLVYGKPVNHVLHLILTLVTCLVWGIVWLVLVVAGGESRKMIQVDGYGNVTVQQL